MELYMENTARNLPRDTLGNDQTIAILALLTFNMRTLLICKLNKSKLSAVKNWA